MHNTLFDRQGPAAEPLIFSDDIKIFSRNAKRSIFVRDLPYCCTSADLGEFFTHALNTPVLHAMVCRNKQGRTLQIGYVLFQSEEAAHVALETMNGRRFIGRDIRIIPYDPKAPSEPSTTGLVHVSFKTLSASHPLVTEATIRRAFEVYGELEHVAIRTHKYTDTGLQGGYGFVTYRHPDLNRYVIEQIRQTEVGGVLYECSWSSLHTHKGATGEEIVIDPRYGYLATKAPGASGATSNNNNNNRGALNDLYGSRGNVTGGRGNMTGGGSYYSNNSFDIDPYLANRRDTPRGDDYLNPYAAAGGAGAAGRGFGGNQPPMSGSASAYLDYERRSNANSGLANGRSLGYPNSHHNNAYLTTPPPPPSSQGRSLYDDAGMYESDYGRMAFSSASSTSTSSSMRGPVSGRAPFAGPGSTYDRGYYEESYRGPVSRGSNNGNNNLFAPRPAMSGRDILDFPLHPPLSSSTAGGGSAASALFGGGLDDPRGLPPPPSSSSVPAHLRMGGGSAGGYDPRSTLAGNYSGNNDSFAGLSSQRSTTASYLGESINSSNNNNNDRGNFAVEKQQQKAAAAAALGNDFNFFGPAASTTPATSTAGNNNYNHTYNRDVLSQTQQQNAPFQNSNNNHHNNGSNNNNNNNMGMRRSADSFAAATDTTDLSFDFGRLSSAPSLSSSTPFDFNNNSGQSLSVLTAATLMGAVGRPSRRGSWETDLPSSSDLFLSREDSEGNFLLAPLPPPPTTSSSSSSTPMNSLKSMSGGILSSSSSSSKSNGVGSNGTSSAAAVSSSSKFVLPLVREATSTLDDLIDEDDDEEEDENEDSGINSKNSQHGLVVANGSVKLSSQQQQQQAEEFDLVPRHATLSGPPPGLMTGLLSKSSPPQEYLMESRSHVEPSDMEALAQDLELKALIEGQGI